MNAVAAYYDWIHGLCDLFLGELEYELGKDFRKRFKDFTWEGGLNQEAALHSEAMMHRGEPYSAPKEYLGWALEEFVKKGFADYKELNQYDRSIERTLKKMAHGFVVSPEAHPALRFYPVIGVGIALGDIRSMGRVLLYVTIRLGR